MAKATQTMKAATAAKKLQIFLPATPEEFQESAITREQYDGCKGTVSVQTL